ncbi:hypothetical protein J2N86_15985 (plasmid) [Legionella lytica]|uniref:Uncharacterized protein n=1 Tax=Legionella lytica TaxID=96232 RepID=A0ABY4YEM4_9GAMM|nr:hypothetical protein [Legionella lytica]USQ15524.1 hypothetical protein J2N86_15985 [Legionella lytica]
MINLESEKTPLELGLSLNDLLSALRLTPQCTRPQEISYSYWNRIAIKEVVGSPVGLDTLIHYPQLCKSLRTFERLEYQIEISLHDIPTLEEQGIDSIIQSLEAIKVKLGDARTQKAKLDARFNNLVFLYGQKETLPILRAFKPYYSLRRSSYKNDATRARKINISGVTYYMRYYGNRWNHLKSLYELNEHHLLGKYFNETIQDTEAITKIMKISLIGGFINTPIFAFRAKHHYKHAGKKYYVDLATNKTYTRLNEAKDIASQYNNNSPLILLEAS